MKKIVSVIIPTLNAGEELDDLLCALEKQVLQPDEIIIIDSSSEDQTIAIAKRHNVKVLKIKRKDFDHGKTRDTAIRQSKGEIVVFLTQDAVPATPQMLTNLILPLEDERVAVSTGRQLPKKNARTMEKLVRSFNYPDESHLRSIRDVSKMGIKTFFCSDVCAAYNRKIYENLCGFDYPVKTNEDMFFAAKAIQAGYRVAYAADAQVYHSHNLTLREQYWRNYIQGYEIVKHKDLLCNVKQESEGLKLVKYVSKNLLKKGQIIEFICFGFDCCARFLGNRAGRRQASLEDHRKEELM